MRVMGRVRIGVRVRVGVRARVTCAATTCRDAPSWRQRATDPEAFPP